MTLIELLQAGGAASIGGAVALLLRQAAHSMRARSERYVADGEMAAGVILEMRQMLADSRDDVVRLEARVETLENDVIRCRRDREHIIRWAQRLMYEMKRRDMTPPDMPAVLMNLEES